MGSFIRFLGSPVSNNVFVRHKKRYKSRTNVNKQIILVTEGLTCASFTRKT